ncbi:MAG: PEGA domain-containing protein [Deltaproteobacteria bacterium]|nr:PEGA domain-containing protein [Deltaproteobacteria bacterium]
MGRWVIAEEHLLAALATDDRWVRHHRSTLQAALEAVRGRVSDLTVTCNVSGATLRVNGVPSGTLPRATPLRVPSGPVVLDVMAEGHDPHRQTVQVTSGTSRVEVTLVAEAAPVAAPPRVVVPTAVVAQTAVVAPPVIAAPDATARGIAPRPIEAPSGSALPALRVTAFALGGVGLAVGVAGLVLRNGAASSFATAGCGTDSLSAQPAGCQSDYDTTQSMQAVEIAGFIGGGVFAAVGVVLTLVRPAAGRDGATAWGCGRGPGTLGLSCGGRF